MQRPGGHACLTEVGFGHDLSMTPEMHHETLHATEMRRPLVLLRVCIMGYYQVIWKLAQADGFTPRKPLTPLIYWLLNTQTNVPLCFYRTVISMFETAG